MKVQVDDSRLLTTEELANYLGVPVSTLYAWRARGAGPEAIRVGRYTRYRMSAVSAWLDAKVKRSRRPS
jgi:excisionase family DNA binding protein